MWKKVLVGIPQGFIKITVIYKKSPPEFSRNSAEIFHGIPLEFFTKFRGILLRRKNSVEFHGIFQTGFLRNSGIPFKKFDRNIIPPEFVLTE